MAPDPDPDDQIVETGGTRPPLLPEDERPVDAVAPEPEPVPEDERLVPDADPTDAGPA